VGQHKADEFGERFVECVSEYVERTGAIPLAQAAADSPPTATARARPVGLTPSPRATLEMFRQGASIEDIAYERQLSARTVEEHLVQAIENGEELDLDRLVSPEKRERIEAVMRKVGDAMLRPVIEQLGEGYSYGELSITRAALRRSSDT
jgi:ATP-dependent DNA helicase RecQ